MTKSPNSEPLLKQSEIASLIGFSVHWIKKQRQFNGFPTVKRGKGINAPVRFRKSAVDKWMEENDYI